MKVRKIGTEAECTAINFNMVGIGEMIVYFPEGDASSEFIRDYEVWLEASQEWKNMNQAFRDHDLITDNYNVRFFEPITLKEREQGFRD